MLLSWALLLGAGAVGYMFLTPFLDQLAVKIFPSATGTTAQIVKGVTVAAGVIAALWIARNFFGRKVKGV